MGAMGRSARFSRQGFAVSLAGALLVATGVIAAGPAAAQGHSARTRSTGTPTTSRLRRRRPWSAVDLFVTNGGSNSVTEVSASTGAFVAGISARRYKFQHPSAIVAVGADLFVANPPETPSPSSAPATSSTSAPSTGRSTTSPTPRPGFVRSRTCSSSTAQDR